MKIFISPFRLGGNVIVVHLFAMQPALSVGSKTKMFTKTKTEAGLRPVLS